MSENPLKNIHFKKFNIKGNSILHAKITWKEDNNNIFKIQLYEECQSWSGRFSREFGKQFSESTDEPEEEYYKNVKQSLIEDGNEYIYDFTKDINTETATFSWKVRFGPTHTMLHGSVPVHKDDPPVTTISFIDSLIKHNKGLNQQNTELQEKVSVMTDELDKFKSEMKGFVESKTDLESTMYGRFINLLNTKKRRILVLEETLKKISSQSDVD